MKSDFEIVKQWKKHLKMTKDGLGRQYRNTQDCQAFYAGDFMDFWIGAQSTDQFGTKKRAMVQVNKVKPTINAVKGFMAQNRRKAKYSARVDGDKIQQIYSDYCNGLSDYVRKTSYADQRETQQDGDMLVCGYGAIETAMTYTQGHATTDPNGRIIKGRLDPEEVGWDPFAKDTNLLDARWVFSEKVYSLEDAIDLFQDSKEDDFESATDDDLGSGDTGYKFYARGGRYNKIKETALDWADEKSEKVKVYFYQWYQYQTFYRCENPLMKAQHPQLATIILSNLVSIAQENEYQDLFSFDPRAEILNFDDKIKVKLEKQFGASIEIHEYRRKCFYSAVISKDHIFTKFMNPCQQGFTIKFKTGDYDAKNKIWTGMVNSMKEPTLYYNKALTELMFIIGSNSKGGVYIEEDAVDDIQAFEQQYAKTDSVIVVAPNAISGDKIKPKKEAYAITGYEQIVEGMDANIQDVTGIDKAFLGSSENKQDTGILYKRRIRQVVSSLACYFDAITLYQLEDARLLLDFLRIYAENNDGGLFSINGEDGKEQFLQISANKLAAEYDVNIDEAPQTPEEKQEFATVLTAMGDKMLQFDLQSAKAIYAVAAKYLPLEHEDKQKLVELLMPPQDQIDPMKYAQLQKMVEQLTSQITQSQVHETEARAHAHNAKANLDTAKIQEVSATIIEKKAHAIHELHKGAVDEMVARKPSLDNHV